MSDLLLSDILRNGMTLSHSAFPSSRIPLALAFALVVFGTVAFFSGERAWAEPKIVSKECVACHAPIQKLASKKFVHAPFKDEKNCESCHKRHGVVGALVLKEEQPALCLSCHKPEEPQLKLAHVHAPLSSGKCTSCHSPHSCDFAKLLKASGNEACFSCHKKEAFAGAAVHKPAAESCRTCHVPHASGQKALLVKPESELCAGCHKSGGSAKAPVHAGFSVEKV